MNFMGISFFTSVICCGAAVHRDEGMRLRIDFPTAISHDRLLSGDWQSELWFLLWIQCLDLNLCMKHFLWCSWCSNAKYGWWLAAAVDVQLVSYSSWSPCITAVQSVSPLHVVWLKSENTFSYSKHRTHFDGCKKALPGKDKRSRQNQSWAFYNCALQQSVLGFWKPIRRSVSTHSLSLVCLPSHARNTICAI